jgi:hypothetical protein
MVGRSARPNNNVERRERRVQVSVTYTRALMLPEHPATWPTTPATAQQCAASGPFVFGGASASCPPHRTPPRTSSWHQCRSSTPTHQLQGLRSTSAAPSDTLGTCHPASFAPSRVRHGLGARSRGPRRRCRRCRRQRLASHGRRLQRSEEEDGRPARGAGPAARGPHA